MKVNYNVVRSTAPLQSCMINESVATSDDIVTRCPRPVCLVLLVVTTHCHL